MVRVVRTITKATVRRADAESFAFAAQKANLALSFRQLQWTTQ